MREETKNKLKDLQTVTIVFGDNTSHAEIITQFVEKLVKARFAPKKEILEHLKEASILLKKD